MNHLGLFAKYWQPGKVKTRLAATVGADVACQLYQVFLFHLLKELGQSGDQRTVVFSPPEKELDFKREILANWGFEPQSDGDLGERMRTFFQNRLPAAAADPEVGSMTKVIAIGADCPSLSAREITDAFDLLDRVDVVIGPSDDGGYYLLGMRNQLVNVFENVAWSTEQVLPQTFERLEQQQKTHAMLEPRIDVDNESDLSQLFDQLERGDDSADPDPANLLANLRLRDQIAARWKRDPQL